MLYAKLMVKLAIFDFEYLSLMTQFGVMFHKWWHNFKWFFYTKKNILSKYNQPFHRLRSVEALVFAKEKKVNHVCKFSFILSQGDVLPPLLLRHLITLSIQNNDDTRHCNRFCGHGIKLLEAIKWYLTWNKLKL